MLKTDRPENNPTFFSILRLVDKAGISNCSYKRSTMASATDLTTFTALVSCACISCRRILHVNVFELETVMQTMETV